MTQKTEPFLSILIPAHNEEENIENTCNTILETFRKNGVKDYEILFINDSSLDGTENALKKMVARSNKIRYVNNGFGRGVGTAIQCGLNLFRGEAVCIAMADLSDSPDDMLSYYRLLKEGHECVFGSRFIKGGVVRGYPRFKLVINRIANMLIQVVFGINHNDITNGFKGYRPLKAITRGFAYTKIPISWTNREKGVSSFKIKEMGSRYLFIIGYVFLEKLLSASDYSRNARGLRSAPKHQTQHTH
jgi:dolichol-phosphate mannosyltransferase